MISNQEVTDLLVDAPPPAYDSLTETPASLDQQVNTCVQEENECFIKEIKGLKEENGQLRQHKFILEQQIELISEQQRLTAKSLRHSNEKVSLLQQNNKLLRIKSSALTEWVIRATEKEEQALLYIEVLESYTLTIAEAPEMDSLHLKMQELEQCLQQQSRKISAEIETQVKEKTRLVQKNIFDLFNKLLTGEMFTKLTGDLEIKFTAILHKEQEIFRVELKETMPQQDALTQEYLDGKTKKLADLRRIHSDEKAQLFYNTAYTVFWAKITGFLSVFSDLVEKKAGFAEKTVDFSSSLIGGFLGSVPFAGPLLDTISSFALKEAGGAIIDYFDNKKAEHFLKIIQNPDHAKKTAELFARSLTLRYQKDIQSWSPKTIESTATLYSNQIYDLSIKGKIYECEDKPAEDKIETFLAALREVSTKEMTYSCPRPSEQSLKTSVHQNTKTLRQTIAKHEFQVKHASVHLEGVKRQNSGLLEESSKQKEQINALKAEVSFLKTRFEERDEEVASLRNEVASLREIIANWLTPETPVPVAPIKKSTKGKSSFFSKKPREERESSFKPQTP